jgi:hypothetical protein
MQTWKHFCNFTFASGSQYPTYQAISIKGAKGIIEGKGYSNALAGVIYTLELNLN